MGEKICDKQGDHFFEDIFWRILCELNESDSLTEFSDQISNMPYIAKSIINRA